MKKLLIGGTAALALSMSAMADTASQTLDISWDSGMTGTVATGLISLPAVASIDSITLELSHTWGGDFDIDVAGPGGSSFVLMMDETALSAAGGFQTGNFDMGVAAGSGALDNVAPYEYSDGLPGFDSKIRDLPGPGGTLGNPDSSPNPVGAVSWTVGPLTAGDYALTVIDDAGGDPGAIGTWTITYTPVPGPGALALLGLAGLAGTRRRRG